MTVGFRRLPSLAFAALSFTASLFSADLKSCTASFTGSELSVANSHIARKWKVVNGLLYATSLRNLDSGVEWLSRPSVQPAPYPAAPLAEAARQVRFTKRAGKAGPVEAESLIAELTTTGPTTLTYRLQVFPESKGISIQLTASASGRNAKTPAGNPSSGANASGIEADKPAAGREPKAVQDALENLDLAPQHLKLTQVRLLDQTDIHNELVFEDEWMLHASEPLRLAGNLFQIADPLTGNGLILLKEAPLPHARPIKNEADFVFEPAANRCRLLGQGTEPEGGAGYRFVTLAYAGGRAGQIEALQNWQRQVRLFDPNRDAKFLSNTWGDRSRDARINTEFIGKEVEAGARLGVDVIQIDDGWQRGRTSNSARGGGVWSGFWAADPNFWEPDPLRFAGGLAPVVKLAADKKMQFGLWFGPDSSNDFSNWEKDAAKILELHRSSGINYVKIDGVKAASKAAERNLRKFFDRVLEESQGAVTFDLDVTAEIRPGYFGMMNVGPVFVENRYTDWHRYWPHQTLRNLWKLSQYVDPLRLRVEFLNNARNTQLYEGDPLRPSAYPPAYLFATTMFANPLGWFETSNLPALYFEQLAPLVSRWKQARRDIFSGTIIPIGVAPDGVSWTGFVSVAQDRRSGYALVFREAGTSSSWTCELDMFAPGNYQVNQLGGDAGAATLSGGNLRVTIPDARRFLWVKLDLQDRKP